MSSLIFALAGYAGFALSFFLVDKNGRIGKIGAIDMVAGLAIGTYGLFAFLVESGLLLWYFLFAGVLMFVIFYHAEPDSP